MQADRTDCSSSAAGVQRILMMVLLSGDQVRWSRAELERELARPGGDAAGVGDAIGALYGAGLVHVSGDLIEPTRPAQYLDDLLGNPVWAVAGKKSAHNVALGEAMRSARRERGDSQETLAGRIGLDRSYYGAIERGGFSPTVDTVAKVATGLGLSLSDLFTRAHL